MSDLIDRQKAIDALRAMQTYKLSESDDMLLIDKAEAQTELMMLPSAQTERTGQWIHDDNFYYETRFVCSECKESECVPTIGFAPQKPLWDYCPNCGAKMDGGSKNAIS